MKIAALILIVASNTAVAACFGTAAFQTCNDNNGNSYSVSRMGNATTVSGYNANTGSNWNESARTIGNSTYINGTAANGNTWNETITTYGNGNRSMYGTSSEGSSFSRYCTAWGCN
ncbi:hypothetical protein KDW55_26720 [Burkholderia sp. AU19243]|uniref:hypothetical protein n=1 Tax=Burkholderia sp. AU19243 TaxID=2824810 RepID=UPI001B904B18|nr:hypothetical protein [Burkholderia sp. AU19243]MBR8366919.1 hypothetical protein [Burkholderia sp. AU19243]